MRGFNDNLQDELTEAEKEWNRDVEKFMASQIIDDLMANEGKIQMPFPISCVVPTPETPLNPNL